MKGILLSLLIVVVVAIVLFVFQPDQKAVFPASTDTLPTPEVSTYVKPSAKRNPPYQIISADTNEFKHAVYLEILIQDKITVEEMIEIAHHERNIYGPETRLHAGFRYFSMNNPYYGTASYLVDCSSCEQRDEDGEPISASIQYKGPADSETEDLIPKSISENLVIARFYDHGWGTYAVIAFTNRAKTQASYFSLYKDGQSNETKLQPVRNGLFKVIETGAKYRISKDKVEYIQTNGTISYTYQRL